MANTTKNQIDIEAEIRKILDETSPEAEITTTGRRYYIDAIDNNKIVELCSAFKHSEKLSFDVFINLAAADFPGRSKRFEVSYQLQSYKHNKRIIIKAHVAENSYIESIHSVFPGTVWFEREAFDLFGIIFSNNPDLRRILTDYGFQGHPLRKDFPLTGHVEVRYDNDKEKVVYEPVNLDQEFRVFDNLSPWQGTEYVLPGDEKAEKNEESNKK
jgi:NADH-quinone oxidoreductase subunit C